MRYTPEIEARIVAQIERTPEAEVILPDWAYWKGDDTPWIYVDGMPTMLARHLYQILVAPLPESAGLARKPGTHRRNVNPHLWVVTPTRHSKVICQSGRHTYTEDDYTPGVGHRCQACKAERLLGTPSAADVNRDKTVCPQGHRLVKRKNGRRRCLECPRIQTARWREKRRKESS